MNENSRESDFEIKTKIQYIYERNELDALDLTLLEQLQRDASLSNQDLALAVHTSAPTCLRRIKRLRDVGLIERQSPSSTWKNWPKPLATA